MNTTPNLPQKDVVVRIGVLFLAAIASVPVWLAINAFVRTVGVQEDEAVTTAATLCFFAGVFFGRYVGIMWTVRGYVINSFVLGFFSLVTLAGMIWLFVLAEFNFTHFDALKLLFYWVPFLVASITLGLTIKLARAAGERELAAARMAAERSKSELHLLQSQLSPHFLFNTLNNLYGLSITQHEKIPPLLLKLSELLRYSVYESDETFVPLKDELNYIENYIEFEKIRIGDRLVLHTDLGPIENTNARIAPMLLIVFVENAFKHSKNTANDQIFITISLKIWANLVLFSIKNSRERPKEATGTFEKNSGLGLANVRKRLDLLYPGDYDLQTEDEEATYSVTLRLKIK